MALRKSKRKQTETAGKTRKTVRFSSDVENEAPRKVIECICVPAVDLDDPRYNGSPMTALRALFVDTYLAAAIRDVRNSTPFLGPMPAFFRPMSLGAGLGLGRKNCQERLVSSVATAVAALSERPLQGVHYTRIIWKVGRFHHISTDLGLEEHVMFALLILKARNVLCVCRARADGEQEN